MALLAVPLGPELPLTLLAALVFFTLISSSSSRNSIPPDLGTAIGLFTGSTLVSCLLSISLKVSIIASLSFIPALFLFIVIANVFTADHLEMLSTTLSLTALLIACIFCFVAVSNPGLSAQGWMDIAGYPHFGVPNDLGILAIMGVFSVANLCFRSRTFTKYLSVLTLLSVLACLVLYKSRGSIVTLTLTTIIIMSFTRPRQIAAALAIILAIILAIDLSTGLSFFSKVMEIERLTVRLPLWMSALHMFADAPLFGLGPGAYSLAYQEYVSQLELPSWILVSQRHMPWPHNLYLELLAERGFSGLLTFLLFITALYRTAWITHRGGVTAKGSTTLLAAVFALTALLISGMYESSLIRHWVLIMYFLIAGALCAAWKSQAAHYRPNTTG